MAQNTYKTYLMKGTGTPLVYTKLCDIKSYPDLGGSPELLETTTLSDQQHTYIPGIEGTTDNLEFVCNFDRAAFNTIDALDDNSTVYDFAVFFGNEVEANVECKFTFKGYISVYANGGDVNEVREMTVVITPTTKISFTNGS